MEHSFNIARGNRDTRIELTQINHNRKIKKSTYEKGDFYFMWFITRVMS